MNIGSRAQVMHGTAKMTGGGLKKKDLKYNKRGKIVSKKKSAMAKKEKRLQKAGFATQKGVFTLFNKQSGGIGNNHIPMSNIYGMQDDDFVQTNPMSTTHAKNNDISLLSIYKNKDRSYKGTNPMHTTSAAYPRNLNSPPVMSDKISYHALADNEPGLPPGWHRAYDHSKPGNPVPYWYHELSDFTTYNKPKIPDLATRIKKEPINLNNMKKGEIKIDNGFL